MTIKLDKTKLVRSLALKRKLVPHIEKALDGPNGDFKWTFDYKPKQGDDAWHPSGDCTPTPHQLYMKATRQVVDKPVGGSLRRTFMVGHFWHQYLQEVVVRAGLAEQGHIERRGVRTWGDTPYHWAPGDKPYPWVTQAAPYHWVTGAADIAPVRLPIHGDHLIDFKTMGGLDFRRNGPPAWAVVKWECQINVYLDFFALEKALIVGISKDSPHDMREFEFRRNQPLIDTLYNKWKYVSECLTAGEAPPLEDDFPLPIKGVVA